MSKLNADGTPRKKYVSKKMRLAESRRKAQKKAWVTRRALYPETNGYKSTIVQDDKEPENGKILTEEKSGVADMLRKTVFELEEIITALKHDLELAKKAIDKAEEQSQTMTDRCKVANFARDEAQEQVQDLNQHNSLLTGELRGANFCFQKLAEEISKGKEVV